MKSALPSLIIALCIGASAQQTYSYLQIVLPDSLSTSITCINSDGTLGGYYVDHHLHAVGFIQKAGMPEHVQVPGAADTFVRGINDREQVVGVFRSHIGCHKFCGFLLSQGIFTTIERPGYEYTLSEGINNAGKIVGHSFHLGSYPTSRAFLYESGLFTPVRYPDAASTELNGINNFDAVVGLWITKKNGAGFVYDHGATAVSFPGATFTFPLAINSTGQVVGWYENQDAITHAFVLFSGTYTKIDPPTAKTAIAGGINDSGVIVGQYQGGDCPDVSCGFVATPVQ